jgi:hypothetical protein
MKPTKPSVADGLELLETHYGAQEHDPRLVEGDAGEVDAVGRDCSGAPRRTTEDHRADGEPEPRLAEGAVDAQVLPEQAAEHDDRQREQQHDDASTLPARFRAADERRRQQSARDPGGGHPEDRQLQVPRAGERIGQQVHRDLSARRPT